MGTLSLIFGIIAIGIAVGFSLNSFLFTVFFESDFIITVGLITIAGIIAVFFIQKYDEDKKNPENSQFKF